jgi:hypothetical protein
MFADFHFDVFAATIDVQIRPCTTTPPGVANGA